MARRLVYFDSIDVVGRLRAADPSNVRRLAESIAEIGLRTPISVMEPKDDGEAFTLVVGLHRLEAMKSLGMESADCEVLDYDPDTAALWEIDENLMRAELGDAERAAHHARRKEIMERRGLVKPHGGDRRSSGQVGHLKSYAADTADKLGVDERTIRRDVRRGENITADAMAAVAGTELDKGVFLDRVVKVAAPEQLAFVQEQLRNQQEVRKLNQYADKAVARSNAVEAAEIIHANLDLSQVDLLVARLAEVSMKDFINALKRGAA